MSSRLTNSLRRCLEFHAGRPPRKLRYPADPPKVEEIIAVMRAAGDRTHGRRLRGLMVILWRAGYASKKRSRSPKPIWIIAAARCYSVAARADAAARSEWTPGAGKNCSPGSSCGSNCPSGRSSASSTVPPAAERGRARPPARTCAGPAAAAGVRRRFAPHQFRHAHAVVMAREGVPLIVIQRQLGHSNLGITSIYLQGIDNAEIIETVHGRRAPMIPVSASLRL
jgi:hypothetical protein